MELLSKTTQTVKIVETRVQDGSDVYFVKDYYDDTDKIIDTTIQTKGGHVVDDPEEYEKILEFVDSLED
jgi:hypothetical protein